MPKKKLLYSDRGGYAYVYVNRKPVALQPWRGNFSENFLPFTG